MSPSVDRPLVLGLRGTTGVHAPNTPPALSAAIAEGADGVVVDVDVTRDGIAVACDDRWLRAFGGGVVQVAGADASAIEALGVLPVTQVIERFSGRGVVGLWLHPAPDASASEARVQALATAIAGSAAWVIGSEIHELVALGGSSAKVRCFYRGDGRTAPEIHGICRPVRLGAPPVATRAPDTLVVGTDCDTPAALRRALEGGFDALLTERPGWLALGIASSRRGAPRSTVG